MTALSIPCYEERRNAAHWLARSRHWRLCRERQQRVLGYATDRWRFLPEWAPSSFAMLGFIACPRRLRREDGFHPRGFRFIRWHARDHACVRLRTAGYASLLDVGYRESGGHAKCHPVQSPTRRGVSGRR